MITFLKVLSLPAIILAVGVIISSIMNPKDTFEDVTGIAIGIGAILVLISTCFNFLSTPILIINSILVLLSGIGFIINLKALIIGLLLCRPLNLVQLEILKLNIAGFFLYGYIITVFGLWVVQSI